MDVRENYGVQFLGYVTAPTTGDYTFYVNSDDQGALFLSTDDNPASKVPIAREPEWNASCNWTATDRRPNRENISAPIRLVAGHRYYLEALMKEAGGGDNLAVAWRKPGDPAVADSAEPIPGRYHSTLGPLQPVTIPTQPQGQTVGERDAVTFSVGITGTPTYDYQWFRNGQMIVGADGPSYTRPSASAADHGAVFHVLTGNGISSVRSADAVLTVKADTTPPAIVSARSVFAGDQVIVRFSEPMDAADAIITSRYQLSGGIAITSASVSADGCTVTLVTSPQTPGTRYDLTVTGLRDTAATPNIIAPGIQHTFGSFALTRGFLRREVWLGIPGSTLAALTGDPRYPDAPDAVSHVTSTESPASFADDYGVRLPVSCSRRSPATTPSTSPATIRARCSSAAMKIPPTSSRSPASRSGAGRVTGPARSAAQAARTSPPPSISSPAGATSSRRW